MKNLINNLISLIVALTHTELLFQPMLDKINTIVSAIVPNTEMAGREFAIALHAARCGVSERHVFAALPSKAKEGAAKTMDFYEWVALAPTLKEELEELFLKKLDRDIYFLDSTKMQDGTPAIGIIRETEDGGDLVMSISLMDFHEWEGYETSLTTAQIKGNIASSSLYFNDIGVLGYGEVADLFA